VTDRRALVSLVLLQLAVIAIVRPHGDFPLNDDWAYALTVQWLLEEGRLRLPDWVGMNLVPQALSGAAVVSLAGFSFDALRHLTQAVSLAALGAAYAWFRAARLEPWAAFAATAALLGFPAWPILSNSFMTDLYGFALALAAAACFGRALEDPERRWLLAATLFSALGVLERQVVLAIPFAFMVALLWTRRPLDRRAATAAILPFALTLAAEIAFEAYLALGPGTPTGHREAHGRLVTMTLKALTNRDGITYWVLGNAAAIPGYLGCFAIGWLAWWGAGGAGRVQKVAIVAGGIAIVALAFAAGWFPPYREMWLVDRAGIGPFLLYDTIRAPNPLDRDPGLFWPLLAIPAAFATAALATRVVTALGVVVRAGRAADPMTVFLVATVVASLAPFVMTDYFERCLLVVLPFLFVLWARQGPAARGAWRVAATLWIAGTIVLSAVATRDYFAWNRARWDAIRTAERLGANDDSIDGGYEYNAFRRFERRAPRVPEGKSWWFVADDRYVVAFSTAPGYEVVATWKVRTLLPRTPKEVKLLRRRP
jgi:hypothetical protein